MDDNTMEPLTAWLTIAALVPVYGAVLYWLHAYALDWLCMAVADACWWAR